MSFEAKHLLGNRFNRYCKEDPRKRLAHLVGQRFGRWTVLSIQRRAVIRLPDRVLRAWMGRVLVRCECGRTFWRSLQVIKGGKSRGCAECAQEDARKRAAIKAAEKAALQ